MEKRQIWGTKPDDNVIFIYKYVPHLSGDNDGTWILVSYAKSKNVVVSSARVPLLFDPA